MATGKSGSFELTGNKGITMEISWEETYDISTNKSTVKITKIRAKSSAYYSTYYLNGTIKINGTTAITMNSTTGTHSVYTSSLNTYFNVVEGDGGATATGSVSGITHNNDGSKSVDIVVNITGYTTSGGAGSGWNVSATKSVALTTIARVSEPTVSASSVKMGSTVTINTNRKADSLTHTLTYTFGGSTGTIASSVGASYKWTVPDLAAKISGETKGTCTITCKTYSGSTLIGTDTVSLTLTVQDASTPTVSASTVQMGKSVTVKTNRESSAFTHLLTYAIGDTTGEIGKVATSVAWTPPKSLAAHTGNELSATCTITCKTYNGSALVGTEYCTIDLQVPDATVPKLSATTVAMGSKITISMDEEAEVYTHELTYSLVEYGGTTEKASGHIISHKGGDHEWTVPLSLSAKIPSDTKATVKVICKTWIGTNLVGTETASFTVTVPNNTTTQPKVEMSVACISDLPSKFSGIYVAGKSKVKVSYAATSDYSTIVSYSTALLAATSTSKSNSYTSALLTTAGEVKITGKVTDARGFSTEKIATINVVDYSRPRILPGKGQNKIVCTRCNSDGKVDAGGVYLLIQIGRKYSKVMSGNTQHNFCTLSYRHKKDAAGDSAYSDPIELLAADADSDYVSTIIPNVVPSNTTAYTIQLIAEDDVGERDTVTVTVPTAFITFHAPEGGHGFTLGGYHDPSKDDVFDCIFDAEFQGNVSGRVLGLGGLPTIPKEADANDYKDFGTYAVTQNAIAETIANLPVKKAGTLRVWSANGSGLTTGNYVYVIQEYIVYDNSATYRRYMMLENDVWVYGSWKVTDGADVIISQGTTDGWTWRKYANGIAECWRRVSQTVDIDVSWGSIYYGNCLEVTFPFDFYSAPVVNATVESGYALWLMSWTGTDSAGTTLANKPASLRVARPTEIAGASIIIAYHAIGRWK
jgi:hypothetical protein